MENLENQTQETLEGQNPEVVSLSMEELKLMIQKESDRRVSEALKTRAKKEKKNEQHKLLQKNDEDLTIQDLQQQIALLTEQAEIGKKEKIKNDAIQCLQKRGLPTFIADYITDEDEDVMMNNILSFEEAFKASVQDSVSKQISSPAPRTGGAKQSGMTKEEFKKLSLAKRQEIYNTNPELYKRLSR